jgi:sigma-B regulation protein RsbU (phosphoserine phosphatase)
MKILIAEDDDVSRRLLQLSLMMAGHEVIMTQNGAAAWEILQKDDSPALAILDWMMPDLDGLEVCRLVRQQSTFTPVYIILLTAKTTKDDVVQGLRAGANDYIFKPFDREELYQRVQVAETVVNLQQNLALRVKSIESGSDPGKQLQGILPICSYCKDIRDDENCWQRLDSYITRHSEAQFSHSICPSCYQSVVSTLFEDPLELDEL